MSYHTQSSTLAACEITGCKPSAEADALTRALADCCHPRAPRLVARLLDGSAPAHMELLRAEVFNLLALSFGPAEAHRRLQTLQ